MKRSHGGVDGEDATEHRKSTRAPVVCAEQDLTQNRGSWAWPSIAALSFPMGWAVCEPAFHLYDNLS